MSGFTDAIVDRAVKQARLEARKGRLTVRWAKVTGMDPVEITYGGDSSPSPVVPRVIGTVTPSEWVPVFKVGDTRPFIIAPTGGGGGGPVAWGDVTGKPSTFPPSSHAHDTADITTGVFPPARLGTGIADSGKVLFGDGTWKDAPSGGGGGVEQTVAACSYASGYAEGAWGGPLKVIRTGNLVTLTGSVRRSSGNWPTTTHGLIATVPAGYRPLKDLAYSPAMKNIKDISAADLLTFTATTTIYVNGDIRLSLRVANGSMIAHFSASWVV